MKKCKVLRNWLFIVIVLISVPGKTTAQSIRSLSDERKQLFDADWKFSLGDKQGAAQYAFDDHNWRKLDLPHDWSIEGQAQSQNPTGNGGGYFPAGIGWYRKSFIVPANRKAKRFVIYFEGVYMNAKVYINGKLLGMHPYGYTSFSYDLTSYIKKGEKNILAVRVDNSQQPNCRWYSGSGIYRHVWMISTQDIHFADWGVFVSTPSVRAQKATVQVESTLKNETDKPQRIHLSVTLLDKASRKAGLHKLQIELPAHSEKVVTQQITVDNPFLWSPQVPSLYTARIEVKNGDRVLDAFNQSFGIRSVKFSTDNGFELNGQTVKLNGGCVHHDNGCLGAAAFDRAEERRVELLKTAGFNAVRTSHNPPSEAFLEACDRLGLLVVDEAFDGWRTAKNKFDYARYFDDWSERDITSMVKRDRNHPSIIIWSIGNEIIERKESRAVQTAKMLAGYVRENDPTRPVTSAMTTWDKDWDIFDPLMAAHDIAGYNYQLARAESDHKRVPSRIIMQTESYPRDAFINWDLVMHHNYILGDFVWTAMDYLGESSIGRDYYPGDQEGQHWEHDFFPWHGAYCGDIDITGWRKPISHYRNILYNNTEKLYLAVREPNPPSGTIKETMWSVWPTWHRWNWPGYEGENINVEVYSKYPSVRLYLNDKLFSEKATNAQTQFKATFPVPYEPGELRAVGMIKGKETESTVLSTATGGANIKLIADRTHIAASGEDLSFITVEITDKSGRLQPDAINKINFKLSGVGEIIGTCNADMKDTIPYTSAIRKVWNGRALLVVRSTTKVGEILIKASSPNLEETHLRLFTSKH